MAEGVLIGAAVGAVIAQAYSDLYNVAKRAVSQMVWCNKYCQALEHDLSTHLPIFTEIHLHMHLPARQWEQPLLHFKETLEKGKSLVESCLQLRRWNLIQKFRYSRAILKLRQEILQHLQNLPALNTLQLQQINATLQDVRERQDKDWEKVMGALESRNTTLVDLLRQGASHDSSTDDERLGKRLDELIQEDRFLVGLDNQIKEVKSLLLSDEEEKIVMILGGMGGIGKTTLALAICKDPQVRGFYENRIHFFTVSQSPDMKGLLSSIWEQVVGERAPQFQNEEDAYRQVKGKLLNMPSRRRLLVLDDVWPKANLKNLSFEVKGFKTMITTRQARTFETRQSHTYNLDLLSKENAQSLFCYWAFDRQGSIPSWVEEPLVVEEVISECKCLPLALRVIGASLSSAGQSPIAWRNARSKLREAKPLGDNYHKDALLGRLQTSIDALDPTLRECFLDLGAYPEDSHCSADTLLDIWVYVRGMEWVDAVLALVDLSNRCLLDFAKEVTSDHVGHALECGSASALVFSQHDVMRDLALYLSAKDQHPSQRTRLLMPANNIPKDWQMEACFAAQVISISTGGTLEQDWPPTLAFPSAEALLLHIADCSNYHLPPFIQSMCKLKVMSIRASYVKGGAVHIIVPSLRGLSQLQSIQMVNVGLSTLDFTTSKLEKLWLSNIDGVAGMLSKEMGNLKCLSLKSGYKLMELPTSFCKSQRLQFLELEVCDEILKLPKDLGQFGALKDLSLTYFSKLRNLPESFGNLSRLKTLDLCGCKSLSQLPRTFGQLVALKKLNLGRCETLLEFAESFGNLSNLETLDLCGCKKLSHLPRTFGQLVALKTLHLGWCQKLQDFPENFGLLRSLENLILYDCRGLKELPQNFGMLSNLKQLGLDSCIMLKQLPDSFGELGCLEYLSLNWCISLKNLPVSFGKLRRLKVLKLRLASQLEALPDSFGQLCCLEFLGLECCDKLKQLPESFGQLSGLRTLEMGSVGLESLPSSISMGQGGLVALESVECSESLVPLWKAARGENMVAHPQIYKSFILLQTSKNLVLQ